MECDHLLPKIGGHLITTPGTRVSADFSSDPRLGHTRHLQIQSAASGVSLTSLSSQCQGGQTDLDPAWDKWETVELEKSYFQIFVYM